MLILRNTEARYIRFLNHIQIEQPHTTFTMQNLNVLNAAQLNQSITENHNDDLFNDSVDHLNENCYNEDVLEIENEDQNSDSHRTDNINERDATTAQQEDMQSSQSKLKIQTNPVINQIETVKEMNPKNRYRRRSNQEISLNVFVKNEISDDINENCGKPSMEWCCFICKKIFPGRLRRHSHIIYI